MLFQISQLSLFFQQMKKKLNKRNKKIQIYCSYEVDSICAVKILQILLSQENMRYSIKPVTSISDLKNKLDSIKHQQEVGYVFFINCGGQIALMDYLKQFDNEKIRGVLMDSHRPLNHQNISQNSKNLIIIDDKKINKENCPNAEDLEYLEEEENEENYFEFENGKKDEQKEKEEMEANQKQIMEKVQQLQRQ